MKLDVVSVVFVVFVLNSSTQPNSSATFSAKLAGSRPRTFQQPAVGSASSSNIQISLNKCSDFLSVMGYDLTDVLKLPYII